MTSQNKYLVFLVFLVFSASAHAATKVNIYANVPSPSEPPPSRVGCKFSDALKYVEAKNPVDPKIPTILLGKANVNNLEMRDHCISTIGNLTRFDEEIVRREIAEILSDVPCEPDAEMGLFFLATERPLNELPRGAKHGRVVNSFIITSCVDPMPADCSYPVADASFDHTRDLVNYEKLMETLKDCRSAIIKKVEKEGLIEKWQAVKDPNKSGSKSTKHQKPSGK